MSLRAALDLAMVGAASSAAFVAYQGGWVPFTSATFLTWLIPSAIGGAIAGGLAAPLRERLGAAWWLVVPVAAGWPFLVGWLAGWRPIHCAGWGALIVGWLALPMAHVGWSVPFAGRLEQSGWRRWALLALVGLPCGFALWHAYYVGWSDWWHGEFVCGGGGGG